MKYIKNFENINELPEIGDFAIINLTGFGSPNSKKDKLWTNYINNQIGIIKKVPILNESMYSIKFQLSDEIIEKTFSRKEHKFIKKDDNGKFILIQAGLNLIIAFGKTIEELELKISAKKYNL